MTVTAQILSPAPQAEICAALNQAVADTVVTTMMAQNFHWNVTGMSFGSLHALFQEIYEDHFAAQDDLAERIKALDGHADGVLADMIKASGVEEVRGRLAAEEMIAKLAAAQRTLAATLAEVASLADQHGDALTEDLAIARGQVHEKFAWLLSAHLK